MRRKRIGVRPWIYLKRFPGAWCDTCRKVQPVILDVMEADERNDHEAADIICDECKSILVTLHAPSTSRPVVRTKKAAKASEMAAQEIDRLIDPSAPDEERQRRKRRLIKGPGEFRDVRGGNRPKLK